MKVRFHPHALQRMRERGVDARRSQSYGSDWLNLAGQIRPHAIPQDLSVQCHVE